MSAIECKIVICSNKATSASALSGILVKDLAQPENEKLARKITKLQDAYVKSMEPLLGELAL
jgi:uncharacterized protein (DUF305 family)